MNAKLLLKMFLTITLLVMVTACGGGATPEPPAEVASDDSAPAEAPVEAEAPAAGFTPSSKCIVPDVVGLDQSAAEGSLAGVGLQPVKSNEYNDLVAAGAVISQEPPAGTTLEPCQGDVVIVVSLGAVPVPTETPGPTETPAPPTETPTPTPVPPTATPTPDPRLFFDDFETGIKPEWGMTGDNFTVINGNLRSEGSLQGFVGSSSWTDYSVSIHLPEIGGQRVEVRLRVQDRNNYMLFKWGTDRGFYGSWSKVVDGQEIQIPGSRTKWFGGGDWEIILELEGDTYKQVSQGDVGTELSFIDNTFLNGGVELVVEGTFELQEFEINTLP